jgi:hypothetical protein
MFGLENCNRRDTEKYFGHKTLGEDRNAYNILFGKSQSSTKMHKIFSPESLTRTMGHWTRRLTRSESITGLWHGQEGEIDLTKTWCECVHWVQGAYHTVEWQPIDKYWCSTNPPL